MNDVLTLRDFEIPNTGEKVPYSFNPDGSVTFDFGIGSRYRISFDKWGRHEDIGALLYFLREGASNLYDLETLVSWQSEGEAWNIWDGSIDFERSETPKGDPYFKCILTKDDSDDTFSVDLTPAQYWQLSDHLNIQDIQDSEVSLAELIEFFELSEVSIENF